MARPLRIEYSGALYHVLSRGDRREVIVEDDTDRERRLEWLARTVDQHNWRVHAFVLMSNHEHLFIETPEPNLSPGMRHLNGVYTQRYNCRHERVGHLFQGRYKAILVDRDSYLLELIRYIVLNPVRAGMVQEASRYIWSSYRATAGNGFRPPWLTTDWILAQFGGSQAAAHRRYADFVAEGEGVESPWLRLRGQVLLGSEEFVSKMLPLLEDKGEIMEIPRHQRLAHRPDLNALFPKAIRMDKAARDEAIRRAYTEYGYTMAAIAREIGMHYSTVSKIIKGER